jgi:hypothetical protein
VNPHYSPKTILTYGQGESMVAERIEEWENTLPEFYKISLPATRKRFEVDKRVQIKKIRSHSRKCKRKWDYNDIIVFWWWWNAGSCSKLLHKAKKHRNCWKLYWR